MTFPSVQPCGSDACLHAMDCEENGCENEAAVRLHIPWDDNRLVCTSHARVLARQDGVVAEPLEGADWE